MEFDAEKSKTAVEIGEMAGQLNITNQTYVLNTINALLFSQQTADSGQDKENTGKGIARADQDNSEF